MKGKVFNIVAISLCAAFIVMAFVPWMMRSHSVPVLYVDGRQDIQVTYHWHSIFGEIMISRVPGFIIVFFLAVTVFALCAGFLTFDIFKPNTWAKKAGIALFPTSILFAFILILLIYATAGA